MHEPLDVMTIIVSHLKKMTPINPKENKKFYFFYWVGPRAKIQYIYIVLIRPAGQNKKKKKIKRWSIVEIQCCGMLRCGIILLEEVRSNIFGTNIDSCQSIRDRVFSLYILYIPQFQFRMSLTTCLHVQPADYVQLVKYLT